MRWLVPLLALCVSCTGGDVSLGEPDTETGGADDDGDGGDDGGPSASATSAGTSGTGSGGGSGPGDSGDGSGSSAGQTESGGIDPPPGATVLFLNFDGLTLTSDTTDDARDNVTQIDQMAIELQTFGDGGQRAEILFNVTEAFAPFDVFVTESRPADGDYTMVVLTPTNPFGSGVGAISPIDCNNANPNNVSFVFSYEGNGVGAGLTAGIVAREVGSTLGLEPVMGGDDFMTGGGPSYTATWNDVCLPLAAAGTQCPAQHVDHCAAGSQNSFAEITAFAGPA